MIVVPPLAITPALLAASNAVDAAAWVAGTTYADAAVVSRNGRNWLSLQAANTGHTPETEIAWWADNGPSNQMAAFDSSVVTATTCTGGLSFTVKCGRITAVGLMGLVGQSVTITVRDDLDGPVVHSETRAIASSDGTFYGWCFEPFLQVREAAFYGLPGAINGYLTVAVAGSGTTAVGLCVMGKQYEVGQAEYGFGMPLEDRGRHYLDAQDNPVSVERGYSKGMSGTVITERANFNRLMAFLADYIGTPCLWVAAPGRGDLVAAIAFGRFVRAVPVIANSQMITASLEIAGNR